MEEFKLNPLTDCETLIMICIWNKGTNVSVGQIQKEALKFGKEYKPTTVYTIISNLIKKGYLTRTKKGASYYTPTVLKEDFLRQYLSNIQDAFAIDISRI